MPGVALIGGYGTPYVGFIGGPGPADGFRLLRAVGDDQDGEENEDSSGVTGLTLGCLKLIHTALDTTSLLIYNPS